MATQERAVKLTVDDETELKMALMRADIANKEADTDYKRGLLRYEPWKVIAVAAGGGAALMAAAVTIATNLLRVMQAH